MWNGVADWLGLTKAERFGIMPHSEGFPDTSLFTGSDLFE